MTHFLDVFPKMCNDLKDTKKLCRSKYFSRLRNKSKRKNFTAAKGLLEFKRKKVN